MDKPLFFFGKWRPIGPQGVFLDGSWVSYADLDKWAKKQEEK